MPKYTNNRVGKEERGTLSSLLLDSSLIIQTKNKNKYYDVKVIQCGEYYQVYRFKDTRIVKDKTIEIDKRKFIVKTCIKKINTKKKERLKLEKENKFKKDYENNIMYKFKKEQLKYESIKKIDTDDLKKINNTIDIEENKKIELRNINRSKFSLQRLVKSNMKEWKTFITLTFEENITSISEANKKFNIWKTYIKRLKNDFKYVCVPEFQKRGAVHYHLLTNIDYNDYELLSQQERHIYKPGKGWQIGRDIKGWKYGHNMAKNMKDFNVIGYITKYMTKDIDDRLFGKQRYLRSRNLIEPSIVYLSTNNIGELIKYFNIIDYSLEYTNIYMTKYDDVVEFQEYRKLT